jgi:hypothetical protein
MTSFLAWVGVDSRSPASIYLASDSRISWSVPGQPVRAWDHGRKVFASVGGPHLLGYVGDVTFASMVLSQLTSAIDAGALFPPDARADERFSVIVGMTKDLFRGLPESERRDFSVVYATRDGTGMRCVFSLWVLHWSCSAGWRDEIMSIPPGSSSLTVLGSGQKHVQLWQGRWHSSGQGDTSRAVFSGFCDALRAGSDPLSGGSPQIVGLYRVGPGRTLGVVTARGPYIYGLPLERWSAGTVAEWRNEAFERVAPDGHLLPDAQRHHTPRGLGVRRAGGKE